MPTGAKRSGSWTSSSSLDPERPRLDAATFVERACEALDVSPETLGSALKSRDIAEVRYLVGGLAIERWRLRAGELAAVLGKRPEALRRWAAWAGKRRRSDGAFRRRYEELDGILCYPSRRRCNSRRLS